MKVTLPNFHDVVSITAQAGRLGANEWLDIILTDDTGDSIRLGLFMPGDAAKHYARAINAAADAAPNRKEEAA